MAKRDIPLFIFDLSRRHGHGECDYVACTDRDNAFVARFDFVDGQAETVTDICRISAPHNNISSRMEIRRITGANPDKAAIRTLMRKAHKEYTDATAREIHFDEPTPAEMEHFMRTFISTGYAQLAESRDYDRRTRITMSIRMMEAILHHLTAEK